MRRTRYLHVFSNQIRNGQSARPSCSSLSRLRQLEAVKTHTSVFAWLEDHDHFQVRHKHKHSRASIFEGSFELCTPGSVSYDVHADYDVIQTSSGDG